MPEKKLRESLEQALELEENFITELAPFMRTIIADSGLPQGVMKQINEKLSLLEKGSAIHKAIVEKLLRGMKE